MQRDMELIRNLLLHIESDSNFDGHRWLSPQTPADMGISDHSMPEIAYHLTLLIEAGLVKGKTTFEVPIISKLTWEGHEFLDDIRDPGIWGKTKERLKGLPTVAIGVVAEIAKAEVKRHLGLP
jgi:hypothetical protein